MTTLAVLPGVKNTNEISEIAEKEQRKIGQDLHDGIGQELTAYALYAASLAEKIDAAAAAGLMDASTLADLQPLAHKLSTGISRSNKHLQAISRGMFTAHVDSNRFLNMLEELAAITNELPGISCSFQEKAPVEGMDDNVATHLFRIAQEAVNNAVKHGDCDQIQITLSRQDDEQILTVADNGSGIHPQSVDDPVRPGMGLRIMNYRAALINGTLTIDSAIENGNVVQCRLPRK